MTDERTNDTHWIRGFTSGGYTSTWCGKAQFNVHTPGEIKFTGDWDQVTCQLCLRIRH